jgi:hypothetical protein
MSRSAKIESYVSWLEALPLPTRGEAHLTSIAQAAQVAYTCGAAAVCSCDADMRHGLGILSKLLHILRAFLAVRRRHRVFQRQH